MSGGGYTTTCYKCGGTMYCWADSRPYDWVSAECLDCGFEYHTVGLVLSAWTVEGQLTLEQVNAKRAEMELEPLTQLAESKNPSDEQLPEKLCDDGSMAIQNGTGGET